MNNENLAYAVFVDLGDTLVKAAIASETGEIIKI